MPLSSKPNYWNLISIILVLLGIALAIYFQLTNKHERQPTFLPTKGLLIYSSYSKPTNKSLSGIKDKKINNASVNLYVQELAFWNKGKMSINKADIIEPLQFNFSDGVEIIEAFVSESTSASKINTVISFSSNTVNFSFDQLEEDEGFIIHVTFSGNGYKKPHVSGKIKGVESIGSKAQLMEDKIFYGIASVLLYAVVLIVLGVLLVLLVVFLDTGFKKRQPKKDRLGRKRFKRIMGGLMVALSATFILTIAVLKVIQIAEEGSKFKVPEMHPVPKAQARL